MNNNKPSNEWVRIVRAFGYSWQGLRFAISHPAFRTELLVACIAIPAAFMLAPGSTQCALMVGSIFLVLIVELLNTAVEKTVDRISADWHALSKQAKDIGSAAVLLSIVNAVAIWLIVLLT